MKWGQSLVSFGPSFCQIGCPLCGIVDAMGHFARKRKSEVLLIYCYSLAEFSFVNRDVHCKPDFLHNVDSMEVFDIPPGILADQLAKELEKIGGNLWGAWGGGLFGFASNQIIIISAWKYEVGIPIKEWEEILRGVFGLEPVNNTMLEATKRPLTYKRLSCKTGMVVFRWVTMLPESTDRYADLSIPCWSYFEIDRQAHAVGLFKENAFQNNVQRMLIVTWYPDFSEWEETRKVGEDDRIVWAQRAALEISHFGIAARMIA